MNEENYRLLLADLEKYSGCMANDRDYERFCRLANDKAFTRHLFEKHGWELPDYVVLSESHWVEISDYLSAGPLKEGAIPWSDDGRQPHGEFLLIASFPTGAYIFGEDYDVALFDEFWGRLMEFGPEYVDTPNHHLYFIPERGGEVTRKFWPLVKEFRERYKANENQRRIEKLKAEIASLGGVS